ncbi:hypothetical protein L3Q65_12975 [Amycolatopsis sp. FU40]|uniref:hypothetical protein n=1 Tax=Amycolatopsis sp. FU40 TaxID=2914159 RepID=UPI001F44E960|nr:hypothetical protein [Amycolatopsis sp. FU40]UKD57592.1 hypothetical protein L3Q65_12975 [Amycolatopsis sp. FU40]
MAPRTDSELSCRALALLRVVAAGRAEITCSSEPDMFIDGVPCCDQYAAHALARRGLIVQTGPAELGKRVRARLTPAGAAVLGVVGEAA